MQDQSLIDYAIETLIKGDYDMVTNILSPSYPIGQTVEVMWSSTYLRGQKLINNDFEKGTLPKFSTIILVILKLKNSLLKKI